MKQLPLALRDGPTPDFRSFIPGPNAAALLGLQRAAAVLDGEAGPDGTPSSSGLSALIYLWGPSGSGKTHLMRALALACEERGGRAGWFTPDDHRPWTQDEPWQLIVLDDCDRFDAGQQQCAFSAFIDASTRGAAVVAAGKLPPVDLPLRDDLRSRLGWGQVFALEPLAEADVRAVIAQEIGRRRLPLSPDVIDFLLTRFERDLGSVMALLDRLDDFALAENRAMTVPLLKKMIAEEDGRKYGREGA